MAKPNGVKDVERFVNILINKIENNEKKIISVYDVVNYCVKYGIIRRLTLRNFLIISEYHKLLDYNDGKREKTYKDLSVKFNIHVNQIKNIIYNVRKTHIPEHNISQRPSFKVSSISSK